MGQPHSANFIDENAIHKILTDTACLSRSELAGIIEKAREAKGLTPREVAALIQLEDEELVQKMFAAALEIKQKIYGKPVPLP